MANRLLNQYSFLTHWRIKAPIQKVYEILKDGPRYSKWWPAYLITERLGEKSVKTVVRAKLPYKVSFVTELVREEPPYEIEIKSSGDLVGTGLWKLQQEGEWTKIQFDWNVRLEKRFFKLLSLFLRPLFRWNHDWVMRQGEKGLASIL